MIACGYNQLACIGETESLLPTDYQWSKMPICSNEEKKSKDLIAEGEYIAALASPIMIKKYSISCGIPGNCLLIETSMQSELKSTMMNVLVDVPNELPLLV